MSIPEVSALNIHLGFDQDNSNADMLPFEPDGDVKSLSGVSSNSKEALELMSSTDPRLPFYYGHRIDSDERFNRVLKYYVDRLAYKREFKRISDVRKTYAMGPPPPRMSTVDGKAYDEERERWLDEIYDGLDVDVFKDWKLAAQETTDLYRDAHLEVHYPWKRDDISAGEVPPFGKGSLDMSDMDDNYISYNELFSRWFNGMARAAVDKGLVSENEIDTSGLSDLDYDYDWHGRGSGYLGYDTVSSTDLARRFAAMSG